MVRVDTFGLLCISAGIFVPSWPGTRVYPAKRKSLHTAETRLTSQGYRVHSALVYATRRAISSKLLIFVIRSFYGAASRDRASSNFFICTSFRLQRYFPRFHARRNARRWESAGLFFAPECCTLDGWELRWFVCGEGVEKGSSETGMYETLGCLLFFHLGSFVIRNGVTLFIFPVFTR